MGNYGMKMSPENTGVETVTDAQAVFTSKYRMPSLIERITDALHVPIDTCSGTYTYTHSLGFFPLVIARIGGAELIETTQLISKGDRGTWLPTNNRRSFAPSGWLYLFLSESFNFKIKVNTFEIEWNVQQYSPQVGEDCPEDDLYYPLEFNIYNFELGT